MSGKHSLLGDVMAAAYGVAGFRAMPEGMETFPVSGGSRSVAVTRLEHGAEPQKP